MMLTSAATLMTSVVVLLALCTSAATTPIKLLATTERAHIGQIARDQVVDTLNSPVLKRPPVCIVHPLHTATHQRD